MKLDSTFAKRFLTEQVVYLAITLIVTGIFWAMGMQSSFWTVLVYSLCLGNLSSYPLRYLSRIYGRRPFPYNWLVFLGLLAVLILPVYTVTTAIVWLVAPPAPGTLWSLITQGWRFPILVTVIFAVVAFLYHSTKEGLEERNVELQKSVEHGAAQLELQDREMERAHEIQASLLPKKIPQLPGFEVAAAWQPARAVGGDYYDVMALGGGKLAFCIADVVGKGVPAALLMASVQATVRAFCSEAVSPAWLCTRVNSVLCGNIANDKFVTFFYGILDVEAHTLRYCNAGHPHPILVSAGGVRMLDGGGAVLGVFPEWKYEDATVELNRGDRLLLFTDGISEVTQQDEEEFGIERIAAVARDHRTSSASALNRLMLAQVTGFCNAKFQDDATLLVIAAD